jgi:hypothetical protein
MRRPTQIPLNALEFPLTLAGGLRSTFDDLVSTPLPGRLAALVRCLSNECSEGEPGHGASSTETSNHIDRRRRR